MAPPDRVSRAAARRRGRKRRFEEDGPEDGLEDGSGDGSEDGSALICERGRYRSAGKVGCYERSPGHSGTLNMAGEWRVMLQCPGNNGVKGVLTLGAVTEGAPRPVPTDLKNTRETDSGSAQRHVPPRPFSAAASWVPR